MGRFTPEQLLKRAEKAFAVNHQWRGLWERAYRYSMPQKEMVNNYSPGQPKGMQVYDSTAPNALVRLANRLHATIFPPDQRWVAMKAGSAIPHEMKDQAQKILDENLQKFFDALAASNFDMVINECLQELCIGTSVMLMEEGDLTEPFRFSALQAIDVGFDEGRHGAIAGTFVAYKIPARVVPLNWPMARLPGELQKMIEDPERCDTEVELLHAVVQEPDKRWCHDLIWKQSRESLFAAPVYEDSSPVIVSRWEKVAKEQHGRGPVVNALPDIMTVNKVVEYVLKNAGYAVSGVYTVADDGVTNPNLITLAPGSFIPVHRNHGHPMGASIAPLENGARFDVASLVLEELRTAIKRAMYDQTLPPENLPVRSATEIIARQKDLVQDLGAAFGRINRELVTPIVIRGLQILAKRGILSYPVRIDGTTVKVEPISPLAAAQGLADIEAVTQWLQLSTSTVGLEMTMLSAKVEDVPSFIGEKLGVPAALKRDPLEKQDLKMLVAQMLASQMQAQQSQAQAGAQASQASGGAQSPMMRAAQ